MAGQECVAVEGCRMNGDCKCGRIAVKIIGHDGVMLAGAVLNSDVALEVAHELVAHAVRISSAEGRQLAGHA